MRTISRHISTDESRRLTGTDDLEVEASISINFNHHKFHPLLYHLPKVKWAVCGSVTWSRESRRYDSDMAGWLRQQDFDGVLHRTCSIVGLRGKDVGIYHATEFGASGECHVHFLVALEGLKYVTPEEFARMFGEQWREEFRPFDGVAGGVGMAEVEPYDPSYGQRGVAYCLKREFDGRGQHRERYDYLSRKLIQTIRQASVPQPVMQASRR